MFSFVLDLKIVTNDESTHCRLVQRLFVDKL